MNEAQKEAFGWLGDWLLESFRSDCEESKTEGAGHLCRPSPGWRDERGEFIVAKVTEVLRFAFDYSKVMHPDSQGRIRPCLFPPISRRPAPRSPSTHCVEGFV